ncbi:IS1 family transposase [Chroococcidiopsis sp. CCMEE 29]|uniref:IS1 family transposase n=1 Tax=Chroococcidiopsis sp. CCMEE 29 TaxID=155894 RepID=UPI0031F9C64C
MNQAKGVLLNEEAPLAFFSKLLHISFELVAGGSSKIENTHLNLRTRINRLARKTICFSKPFPCMI